MSADGSTVVAGAPYANAGYVFVKPPLAWRSGTETAKLTSNHSRTLSLGRSVGVSGDGSTAVVGAPDTFVDGNSVGAAFVYSEPSSGWQSGTEQGMFTSSDGADNDAFGWFIALSADGSTVAVGARFATVGSSSMDGAAYVFGLAPQSSSPPAVTGTARQGQTLTESHATWSPASSYTYQWSDCNVSGSSCVAIPGATSQTYTLAGSDVGHTIRVAETAHNLAGATTAVSGATGVVERAPATQGAEPPQIPELSMLRVSPREVSIAGRLVQRSCVKPTRTNRSQKPCVREVMLRVSYTLSTAASVTVTVRRLVPGKRANGRCVKPTTRNNGFVNCTRTISVRGMITIFGQAGPNGFTYGSRIGGRTLGPGSYQLIATPSAGGTPGARETVALRLIG